jgi:hypothetical protein
MKYTRYQQGENITLEGLKYHLRIVDNTHDAELAALLKNATIYAQEYFNTSLVECSILQEQPQADTIFKLFLNNRTNIRVTDWSGNTVAFEIVGDKLTISQAQPVKITYDCEPSGEADGYAIIVYQIAGANYDGQPEQIAKILRNYPVI